MQHRHHRRPLTLREEAEMLVRYSSLQRRRFCRCFIDMTRARQGLALVAAELGRGECALQHVRQSKSAMLLQPLPELVRFQGLRVCPLDGPPHQPLDPHRVQPATIRALFERDYFL